MKLLLIDKNFYPIVKPSLNAVYIAPGFFGNKYYHIFFIKSSTFSIGPLKDLSMKVTKEHLTFEKYKFNFATNINMQLNKITENLGEYKEILFVVPDIYPYRVLMEVFMRYFNLSEIKVIYENNLTDATLLEKIENKDFFIKERSPEILRKEFVLKTLDRLTYNFFYQKTPLKTRIKLSTLMLDAMFREKESRNVIKGTSDLGEIFAYRMFDEKNIFGITNKYMFLDILFNDIYFDPNVMNNILEKYRNFNGFNIFDFDGRFYLTKENIVFFDYKQPARPKIEEGFILTKDYFTFDEINYELTEKIYENSLISEDLEIISYDPVPLNFDIENFVERMLSIENDDDLVNELNLYTKRLSELVQYSRFKPIISCPECIDGKIFENDYIYFCNKCDFKFLKHNKAYNLKINKRLFILLVKYKITEIYYKGEIRKIKFVKGENGWFNIKMLK